MCFKSRTSSSHPRSSALCAFTALTNFILLRVYSYPEFSHKKAGFSVTYTHTDGASSSAESRARVDIQRQSAATSFFFFFFFFFSLLLFSSRRRRRRNRNSMLRVVDFGETRNERIRWWSFSRRSSSFSPRARVGNGGNGVVRWRRGGGLSLRRAATRTGGGIAGGRERSVRVFLGG